MPGPAASPRGGGGSDDSSLVHESARSTGTAAGSARGSARARHHLGGGAFASSPPSADLLRDEAYADALSVVRFHDEGDAEEATVNPLSSVGYSADPPSIPPVCEAASADPVPLSARSSGGSRIDDWGAGRPLSSGGAPGPLFTRGVGGGAPSNSSSSRRLSQSSKAR